jgi:hypothetical protein
MTSSIDFAEHIGCLGSNEWRGPTIVAAVVLPHLAERSRVKSARPCSSRVSRLGRSRPAAESAPTASVRRARRARRIARSRGSASNAARNALSRPSMPRDASAPLAARTHTCADRRTARGRAGTFPSSSHSISRPHGGASAPRFGSGTTRRVGDARGGTNTAASASTCTTSVGGRSSPSCASLLTTSHCSAVHVTASCIRERTSRASSSLLAEPPSRANFPRKEAVAA